MGTVKVTNIEPIADNGTLTIGNSGDTIALTSGAKTSGFGKIGQVVKNASTTSITSSTHSSYTELINASITLTNTSSKILILATVPLAITAGSNAYAGIQIYRGTISGGTALKAYAQGMASGTNNNQVFGVQLIDEPSSTGSQQYTIGIRTASSATSSTSTDSGPYEITLMEILD